MRVFNVQQVARPAYIDRTPGNATQVYGLTSVAPHAATQRASFTVPANRRAAFEDAFVDVHRQTAAGTPALFKNEVGFTASGGSRGVLAKAAGASNVVDAYVNDKLPATKYLQAGDAVDSTTADASTTGTIEYNGTLAVMQFLV